ncbi:ImmA/IrrE family metallo-endopeptidase [Streptomyces sp. BI20]|uniref:ImmA/IrrE family metallo-endopeptidase n=1 Tax=Streptomyces sp. BI20 TaxID=3403460 RepID=UPI003C775046
MPFRHQTLRRRCETVLARLDLSRPFSLDDLCARVAEQRGRPIRLHPLPKEAAESGVCGLWVGTAGADYVFYEANTSLPHREHIVLHELGHILFGHHGLSGEDQDDADAVPVVRGRTNYTTRQEQEAEMLASMIRTRSGLHPHGTPRDTLQRLESALGVRPHGSGGPR